LIHEDRDREFWRNVYEHPEVKPHVGLGHDLDVAALAAHPGVIPLRSEHGGFFFVRLDSLGRVYELHTLYTPEGWGREVHLAAKQAFNRMFAGGAQVITTQEVEGHRASQPPRSFGFVACGDFEPVPHLNVALRSWVLTRTAWEASPAYRSLKCR
jgi:hypothetical protein